LSIVVTFQDIAGDKLKEQGLGGLYSVGQAATSPPRLLMLDYHPVTATTDPELLLKEFDSKVADWKHSVADSQTIANRRMPDTLSKRICKYRGGYLHVDRHGRTGVTRGPGRGPWRGTCPSPVASAGIFSSQLATEMDSRQYDEIRIAAIACRCGVVSTRIQVHRYSTILVAASA
jgi:hypothetical protein